MWNAIISNSSFLLGALLWAATGAIVFWLLFLLPYRLLGGIAFEHQGICEEISLLFFGCILGLTIGITTGLSREAAVGAVVPAILALIGALIGYLYSTAANLRALMRYTTLVSALALTIFFFWGTFTGAAIRVPWEQYARDFELYKIKYTSDLENLRKKYEAQLQRIARIHQTELELYKQKDLKSRKKE